MIQAPITEQGKLWLPGDGQIWNQDLYEYSDTCIFWCNGSSVANKMVYDMKKNLVEPDFVTFAITVYK